MTAPRRSSWPRVSATDVEVLQTYASGPASEVNSIIWPNPEFDNDITVYGPEVKSLVQRYLDQMLGELAEQPDPDDPGRPLLDSIELIVPHQANKTMILDLAGKAGLVRRPALLQHLPRGQRLGRLHPDRAGRRGPRRRHHPADPGVRARLRGRRRRRLRGAAGGPGDRRAGAGARGRRPARRSRAAGLPTTSDDVRVAFGE